MKSTARRRSIRETQNGERSPFNRTLPDYRIVRADDGSGDVELFLYDEIGFWGIQASTFVRDLKSIDAETIHLRINSPGGSVFDGVAIANAIREHKATVIVHVDALAASIASVIALAGDEVHMADNAFLMIHNAWTGVVGNADDLRKTADILDKVDDSAIVRTYMNKTGADEAQVREWMKDETWFTAEEALAEGFIDVVDAQSDTQASFDLSVFAHAPAALARREAPPVPKDLERALRDAGLSRAEAKALMAGGLKAVNAPKHEDASDSDRAALLGAGKDLLAALSTTRTTL
jgi:ATP-dependent Clp protease protease subunit